MPDFYKKPEPTPYHGQQFFVLWIDGCVLQTASFEGEVAAEEFVRDLCENLGYHRQDIVLIRGILL